MIDGTEAVRGNELWTYRHDPQAGLRPANFGQDHGDESNALQLWSTIYLAIERPPEFERGEGRSR
jgi:hypothetical protein